MLTDSASSKTSSAQDASTRDAQQAKRPALLSSTNVWFFLVALVALALDQLSKRMVEATLPVFTPTIPLIGHWLEILHTQNLGAAFSLLQNGGLLFGIAAVVVSCVIACTAPRLPARERLMRVCLGLVLGGAVGNLIDRIRQGYVTDWIHFQIPEIGFDWPVFNVADSCVVVGVITLMLLNLSKDRRSAKAVTEPGK